MTPEEQVERVERAKPFVMGAMKVYGQNRAVGLEIILAHMPGDWRTRTQSPRVNRFNPEMTQVAFLAIAELVAEGKLRFVPHFIPNERLSVVRANSQLPLGRWEIGVMVV